MNVSRLIELSPKNGRITDTSSNREYSSLFRPRYLLVQRSFLHQSFFLDMLPSLLLKGKRWECREATLSRFLLEIFMKYKTVLSCTEHYCLCTAQHCGRLTLSNTHSVVLFE